MGWQGREHHDPVVVASTAGMAIGDALYHLAEQLRLAGTTAGVQLMTLCHVHGGQAGGFRSPKEAYTRFSCAIDQDSDKVWANEVYVRIVLSVERVIWSVRDKLEKVANDC